MHRHAREDEYSYVLEGRVGALLGDHCWRRVLVVSFSNRVTSGTRSGMQEMRLREFSRSSLRRVLSATLPNSSRSADPGLPLHKP